MPQPRRLIRLVLLLAITVALVPTLMRPTVARAADFPAACDVASLKAAIASANALGGADTVTLAAACTYTLTTVDNSGANGANGLPVIISDITIVGNGATITRDSGAPRFRIFEVAAGGALTVQNATLSNGAAEHGTFGNSAGTPGRPGGAILSGGPVTLTNATLSGNSAGNGGSSYVDGGGGGSGGGVYSSVSVSITGSTLSGNQAGGGGGNDSGLIAASMVGAAAAAAACLAAARSLSPAAR